jgi:thrombospondin type 3 repeat protein
MMRRLCSRLRSSAGQAAIEYVGVVVVLAAVVVGIAASPAGEEIREAIDRSVCRVLRDDQASCGEDPRRPRESRRRAANRDSDGDGLKDAFERERGTNPRRRDSDGDGRDDRRELLGGENPR